MPRTRRERSSRSARVSWGTVWLPKTRMRMYPIPSAAMRAVTASSSRRARVSSTSTG